MERVCPSNIIPDCDGGEVRVARWELKVLALLEFARVDQKNTGAL